MGRRFLWTPALVFLAAVGCESRALSGSPAGTQTGTRNFGFFPSFAATIPGTSGRANHQKHSRRSRSIEGGPETDVLEVDDFLRTNGLGVLDAGEAGYLGEDGSVSGGEGSESGSPWPEPDNINRIKRQEEEAKGNNLSWLLEHDAWEKVEGDDALNWDNIVTEMFDAGEEAAPRDTRAVVENEGAYPRISEDAVYQRFLKLYQDLDEKKEEMESEGQVGDEGGEESVELSDEGSDEGSDEAYDEVSAEGSDEGSDEFSVEESGEKLAENTDGDKSPLQEVDRAEEDYLDDLTRRRRSEDGDVSVVQVEGRIDLSFKSAKQEPIATVIIQKDPLPPNPPDIPPPIHFCGTKTDPNNLDSVSGEVSETVAVH